MKQKFLQDWKEGMEKMYICFSHIIIASEKLTALNLNLNQNRQPSILPSLSGVFTAAKTLICVVQLYAQKIKITFTGSNFESLEEILEKKKGLKKTFRKQFHQFSQTK